MQYRMFSKRLLQTKNLFLSYPLLQRRLFHYEPDSLVIASAIRTPCGHQLHKYIDVDSSYLSSVAVEAAIKQSGAPLERCKYIYMARKPSESGDRVKVPQVTQFFKKCHYEEVYREEDATCHSLLRGIHTLKNKLSEFVVVGGVDFESNATKGTPSHHRNDVNSSNYYDLCREKYMKASQKGIFASETVPINVNKQMGRRKVPVNIAQDLVDSQNQVTNSAAAMVLCNSKVAKDYNIKPIAVIKNFIVQDKNSSKTKFNFVASTQQILQSLLTPAKIGIPDIHHMELLCSADVLPTLENNLNISPLTVNPCGTAALLKPDQCSSLSHLLVHLSHYLPPKKFGCALSSNAHTAVGVVIEKPLTSVPNALPMLTLFTKNLCRLCDVLVEELETHFSGEYQLETVHIDEKENVRFLRLYRYDIPVLYLNGQFLCMHRLNVPLLRMKLDMIKSRG